MHILIIGAAGFIGSAVALRVLEQGDSVLGIDVGVPKFVEWYQAFYGVAGKGRVLVRGAHAA